MNPVTATFVLLAVAVVFIALWAWLAIDFRRFSRRHPRVEQPPADDVDFAEALRCTGGRLSTDAPTVSTPLLDAYRERR